MRLLIRRYNIYLQLLYNKKMSHDKISSGINSQEEGIHRILEEAAAESRRISLAIQEIAGTTSCKGVQIHGLGLSDQKDEPINDTIRI